MNGHRSAGDRSAVVAYGSETGNALDYAEELGRTLERLHIEVIVCALDKIDPPLLASYTFVVVVASTTGQGDLPGNSRAFWRSLLRKKLPPDYLAGVKFTSFGLGDSSYPRYNWATRKIHKRLLQLGATDFYDRGEADEQHDEGLDASFVPWSLGLRQKILELHPLAPACEPIPDDVLLPPKWLLDDVNQHTKGDNVDAVSQRAQNSLDVKLRQNRRLTPQAHWQDVRHLTFSSDEAVTYSPGDVLTIYPENHEADVDRIINLMQWNNATNRYVQLKPMNSSTGTDTLSEPPIKAMAGQIMTFKSLLRRHLDLTAVPRRPFFSLMAQFTEDSDQKERLIEFTRPEYIDELFDYTTRPRRSILEVLQEFHTVKIPWRWAANVFPELRGRQFSIASGGDLKAGSDGTTRFELLVAIVRYKTLIKKLREGVCSKYLASLKPDAALRVTLERGSFKDTMASLAKPLVMIGPGTGVAPIRSLLWERAQLAQALYSNGCSIGKSLLIFGCRNEHADFFFRDEWQTLKSRIPLDVRVAFSRDQKTKTYVQDIVRQHKTEICKLLYHQGGSVLVCGSSGKMPTAVRAALADALRESDQTSQVDADAYLESMEKTGRYTQETWS